MNELRKEDKAKDAAIGVNIKPTVSYIQTLELNTRETINDFLAQVCHIVMLIYC